jgi:predicted dehydrogenase
MTDAAEAAGVKAQVGFNFLMLPMIATARDMIAAGTLGEITGYRGLHAEDYMADPNAPWSFRHDPLGGGALADIGSHALATAEFLLGPIEEVLGQCQTVIAERPDGRGGTRKVDVDDIGRALRKFDNGVTGSIEANWVATGKKMQHDFEVYGSKGGLGFSGERMNELRYYDAADSAGQQGFRTIQTGPDHPPYGKFCVAPGHQLGFNDLKAIEIFGYAQAIAGIRSEPFNFRAGHRIQKLVETIHGSNQSRQWETVN